jgi:hypothetical protein
MPPKSNNSGITTTTKTPALCSNRSPAQQAFAEAFVNIIILSPPPNQLVHCLQALKLVDQIAYAVEL